MCWLLVNWFQRSFESLYLIRCIRLRQSWPNNSNWFFIGRLKALISGPTPCSVRNVKCLNEMFRSRGWPEDHILRQSRSFRLKYQTEDFFIFKSNCWAVGFQFLTKKPGLPNFSISVDSSSGNNLKRGSHTAPIGDTFYLLGLTKPNRLLRWKSSKSEGVK